MKINDLQNSNDNFKEKRNGERSFFTKDRNGNISEYRHGALKKTLSVLGPRARGQEAKRTTSNVKATKRVAQQEL